MTMTYYKIPPHQDEAVLIHHGIKGQRWGVRRYQNEDGTLIEAGKKRYYASPDDLGVRALNEKGKRYNKRYDERVSSYSNAIRSNVENVNPQFKNELERFKTLNKKNNEFYLKERDKWFSNQGEYKGKDYYQFKDISAEKWRSTDDGKKEAESYDKLEAMVRNAAKEHPLYAKTYGKLKSLDMSSLTNDPILVEKVSIGEEAVKNVMQNIKVESRKDHK